MSIRQITAAELKTMLDQATPLTLYDVRTDEERRIATIAGARHLDEAGVAHLQAQPKDALIVFHCHHGMRSRAAARHFAAEGFTNLCNLAGGIDAWSLEVDPSVPRY